MGTCPRTARTAFSMQWATQGPLEKPSSNALIRAVRTCPLQSAPLGPGCGPGMLLAGPGCGCLELQRAPSGGQEFRRTCRLETPNCATRRVPCQPLLPAPTPAAMRGEQKHALCHMCRKCQTEPLRAPCPWPTTPPAAQCPLEPVQRPSSPTASQLRPRGPAFRNWCLPLLPQHCHHHEPHPYQDPCLSSRPYPHRLVCPLLTPWMLGVCSPPAAPFDPAGRQKTFSAGKRCPTWADPSRFGGRGGGGGLATPTLGSTRCTHRDCTPRSPCRLTLALFVGPRSPERTL